jgi:hypothetical protein
MDKLIKDTKKKLGRNLVSVISFGTEGEPNNICIITKSLDFDVVDSMRRVVREFAARNKVVPLLFTEAELKRGADVFPLEFLDMKHPHKTVYGRDVLASIRFDKKAVRRQIEFELRSKLIHLRADCLHIRNNKDLKTLLKAAVPSLMPLFYGLIFLKGKKIPDTLEKLYDNVEDSYDVDLMLFRVIKRDLVPDDDLVDTARQLMVLLEEMISIVDRMKVR